MSMSRPCTGAWRTHAVMLLATLVASIAQAAGPTPLVPMEDFIRQPEFRSIRFSPDGKRFAAIVESKGRAVLTVVDFATHNGKSYAPDRGLDVDSFRCLTNHLITIPS